MKKPVVLQPKNIKVRWGENGLEVENGWIHPEILQKQAYQVLLALHREQKAGEKRSGAEGGRARTITDEHDGLIRCWWDSQTRPTVAELERAAHRREIRGEIGGKEIIVPPVGRDALARSLDRTGGRKNTHKGLSRTITP